MAEISDPRPEIGPDDAILVVIDVDAPLETIALADVVAAMGCVRAAVVSDDGANVGPSPSLVRAQWSPDLPTFSLSTAPNSRMTWADRLLSQVAHSPLLRGLRPAVPVLLRIPQSDEPWRRHQMHHLGQCWAGVVGAEDDPDARG